MLTATLGIFAYNHAPFVREALLAAFHQSRPPERIIITDDASTDVTAQVIESVLQDYSGPSAVTFVRNPKNLGLLANINRRMEQNHSDVFVGAWGDDVSLPNRVADTMRAFESEDGSAMSVFGNGILVDEHGSQLRPFYYQPPAAESLSVACGSGAAGFALLGAAHAWRAKVFEVFGPLPEELSFDDVVIPFRSALIGKVVYVDKYLIKYRMHGGNIYNSSIRSTSISDWRKGQKLHTSMNLIATECKLHDIETASALQVCPKETLAVARRNTGELLEYLRLFARALNSSRLSAVLAVRSLTRRRPGVKQVLVWLLTFGVPELYMPYMRFRAARVDAIGRKLLQHAG